jgi:hypothetical protein
LASYSIIPLRSGFSDFACYIPSWSEEGPVDLEARLAGLVEKQLLEDAESSRPRQVRSACTVNVDFIRFEYVVLAKY